MFNELWKGQNPGAKEPYILIVLVVNKEKENVANHHGLIYAKEGFDIKVQRLVEV